METISLEILKEAMPGLTAEDLNVPFSDSGIHSLDSIVLRDTIERYFGLEIADKEWDQFNSLSEALEYCYKVKNNPHYSVVGNAKVSANRSQEIKMPQMANSALSENWLLKEMGDLHWELLSRGLEQKSSGFTDNLGNRLYAAFVRINYSLSPLNAFKEHDIISLGAAIKRFGNYAYYSSVNGACNDKFIKANLMTSFSCRKTNDNSQIAKSAPEEKINNIEELEIAPDFYTEHRLIKKGLINEIQTGEYNFKITDNVLESICHSINPHFEINGVGLLYFASYPLISDECCSEFFRNTMEMTDYNKAYHTIYRDTFYFANCNADDQIIVKLNSIEMLEGNQLQMATSLYRQSDNKLMAKIFTVKQKHQTA